MGKKNKKKKRLIQRGLIQVLINLSGNPKFKFFKVWDILRETSGFFSRVHICLLRAFPQFLPEAHECCKGKPREIQLSMPCCRWALTWCSEDGLAPILRYFITAGPG